MAKNGRKLSKVAIIGSTRSLLAKNGRKWVLANQVHPRFWPKEHREQLAPAGFGHCPFFPISRIGGLWKKESNTQAAMDVGRRVNIWKAENSPSARTHDARSTYSTYIHAYFRVGIVERKSIYSYTPSFPSLSIEPFPPYQVLYRTVSLFNFPKSVS